MVNTEKLNAYVKKSGLSWAEHVRDIGGIPEDMETFAETFEDEASADTVSVLIAALSIPASDVGPVFFAPAKGALTRGRCPTWGGERKAPPAGSGEKQKPLAGTADLRYAGSEEDTFRRRKRYVRAA